MKQNKTTTKYKYSTTENGVKCCSYLKIEIKEINVRELLVVKINQSTSFLLTNLSNQ